MDKNMNKETMTGRLLFSTQVANYQRPILKEIKSNGGYISYGHDNEYPQYLINMFYNSALHNAIITGKVDYVVGEGLYSDSDNPGVTAFIEKCNTKGDTLDDVFKKCAVDYEIFGGFAFQVIYEKLGGKIAEIYYIDFSKLRYNIDGTKLKYSKDWSMSRVRTSEYNTYDPSDPVGTQIFYYNGAITRDWYPVPIYIGSVSAIETDIEISNFHLNSIKNGMFPSIMIDFKNGEPTEEEKAAIEKMIRNKWGGTNQAGKFLLSFSDKDNPSPEIIPVEQPDLDKRFLVLQDSVRDRIFVGHRVTTPILFGVQVAGKLGNTREFNEGYQIFQNSYIKPVQKTLLDIFNNVISVNFPDPDIQVQPVSPLDNMFTNEQIISENMNKTEIRTKLKEWGYIDEVEEAKVVNTPINTEILQ